MYERIHAFRQKLRDGRLCLGPAISLADPAVTEAVAPAADYVWIDLEHSVIGFDSLLAHLIAARAGNVAALVRIPIADVGYVKRVLDNGADGIIVPQIRTADEARQMVAACRYPPQGNRGFGPKRCTNYGRTGGPDYFRAANEGTFVSVQIETVSAYEALDEILAIPTLDAIVIGPYDLSGSMGILGQLDHPKLLAAIEETAGKARAKGLSVGWGMSPQPEILPRLFKWGINWMQYGNDFAYLVQGLEASFRAARTAVGQA